MNMLHTIKPLSFAGCALLLAACGQSDGTASASAPAPAAQPAAPQAAAPAAPAESAHDVFKNRCAPCHGENGLGDGPAAIALNPKPRNYSDAAWQTATTDEQIKKTILYGGAAVGKSAAMPSQPDLESKPEQLDGLVKIIRGFGAAK